MSNLSPRTPSFVILFGRRVMVTGGSTGGTESPSGKASVFGADIRWFESTLPSQPHDCADPLVEICASRDIRKYTYHWIAARRCAS